MTNLHPTIAQAIAPWCAVPAAPAIRRPSDRQLLQAVADMFSTSATQAHEWLYTFDFDAVNDELLGEERAADFVASYVRSYLVA